MQDNEKLVVIFDGSCNFCTATTELLLRLDRWHRLCCLPFQAPQVPQNYGLTVEQCEQAAWAITPAGVHYRGAQAISTALDVLCGWSFFSFLYRLPGVHWCEDRVYQWVVEHRRFLPGTRPYCERPDAPCGK